MNVLVTGAGGFLGRHVVAAMLARGHHVRALVRPSADRASLPWREEAALVEVDMRRPKGLASALEEVDAVVHLAATVGGDAEAQFGGTVVTTENLLAAMASTGVRRLVLASSFTVYDWRAVRNHRLDERTPLEPDPDTRGGYTVAKVWQERLARRAADAGAVDLTVLRPGMIWGPGAERTPQLGPRLGRAQVLIGPSAELSLSYVENCADCFAAVAEDDDAVGETFNVVDGHGVSRWRYSRAHRRRAGEKGFDVGVPYAVGLAVVTVVHAAARLILGKRARVPSIFVPERYRARFRPVRTRPTRLAEVVGWHPPWTFEDALRRTYASRSGTLTGPRDA